jgi:hypothetical protein
MILSKESRSHRQAKILAAVHELFQCLCHEAICESLNTRGPDVPALQCTRFLEAFSLGYWIKRMDSCMWSQCRSLNGSDGIVEVKRTDSHNLKKWRSLKSWVFNQ